MQHCSYFLMLLILFMCASGLNCSNCLAHQCTRQNAVPDRMHSYRPTALSDLYNRIVGKILLCTSWYHALFSFRSGVFKYFCSFYKTGLCRWRMTPPGGRQRLAHSKCIVRHSMQLRQSIKKYVLNKVIWLMHLITRKTLPIPAGVTIWHESSEIMNCSQVACIVEYQILAGVPGVARVNEKIMIWWSIPFPPIPFSLLPFQGKVHQLSALKARQFLRNRSHRHHPVFSIDSSNQNLPVIPVND